MLLTEDECCRKWRGLENLRKASRKNNSLREHSRATSMEGKAQTALLNHAAGRG